MRNMRKYIFDQNYERSGLLWNFLTFIKLKFNNNILMPVAFWDIFHRTYLVLTILDELIVAGY